MVIDGDRWISINGFRSMDLAVPFLDTPQGQYNLERRSSQAKMTPRGQLQRWPGTFVKSLEVLAVSEMSWYPTSAKLKRDPFSIESHGELDVSGTNFEKHPVWPFIQVREVF